MHYLQAIDTVLLYFSKYPPVLLALYVFTLFFPRKASYFYAFVLAAVVSHGFVNFDSRFEESIHTWLTTSNTGALLYSLFEYDSREGALDAAERAFSAGLYLMLKASAVLIIVAVPFAAKARVKEAIANIGRRPLKDKPPVL